MDFVGASNVITGTIGIDDVQSAKQVIDMSKVLHHRYMDIDPLFRIFNMIEKGPVTRNPKINWLRKELFPREFFLTTDVSASASAGATVALIPALTAGGSVNTDVFKVGDVIQVPAGTMSSTHTNIGVITAVTASTSITVDPIGYDSDGASTDKKFTATTTGQRIHLLHDASEEYSQSPTAKVVKDDTEWNYIHFQRYPYIIGNLQMDQENYTGPERAERREETMKEIRINAEMALLFGERYKKATGAGGNGAQYFMRGLWEYIRNGAGSNIYNGWTSGFTEADLDEYLVTGPCRAGYGSNVRLLFASSELYLKLTELMKKKVGNLPEKNKFGLSFESYRAPGGKEVLIREHHLFTGDREGQGIVVDPGSAMVRGYGTQGTIRLLENIQENDRAGLKDEWQVIFSLQVPRVEPHGYITP